MVSAEVAQRRAADRWFLERGLPAVEIAQQLLAEWTRNGPTDGQILGMTLPVPQPLIQTSMSRRSPPTNS